LKVICLGYSMKVVHLSWSLPISNSRGLNKIRRTCAYTDNITHIQLLQVRMETLRKISHSRFTLSSQLLLANPLHNIHLYFYHLSLNN
jgi:hypothetical protein